MDKKIIIGLIILVIAVIIGWKIMSTKAPDTIPKAVVSDSAETPFVNSFNFTGYGPGKEHRGTFTDITYGVADTSGVITGSIVINNASVSTGIEGLDKHLCAADFIDCATYPTTTFKLDSVTKDPATGGLIATGSLSFKETTKQISFPVSFENGIFKGDFRLGTNVFGFSSAAIKDEIRIEFAVKA